MFVRHVPRCWHAANEVQARLNVRFGSDSGAEADIAGCRRCAKSGREQLQQTARLFDHFIGKLQKMQRHLQTERFRGLEVNDELNLRDLLHWQVGGFRPLENAAGVNADSTIRIRNTGPVS